MRWQADVVKSRENQKRQRDWAKIRGGRTLYLDLTSSNRVLSLIAPSREANATLKPTQGQTSSLQVYERDKAKLTSLYLLLLTVGLRKRVV